MLDQIIVLEDFELYMSILAVVSTVYQPIIVDELVTLIKLPNRVNSEYEALVEIISYYRSFFVIRERIIFFIY